MINSLEGALIDSTIRWYGIFIMVKGKAEGDFDHQS
jgi:hypothetical protein